jgi:hypothetical protein
VFTHTLLLEREAEQEQIGRVLRDAAVAAAPSPSSRERPASARARCWRRASSRSRTAGSGDQDHDFVVGYRREQLPVIEAAVTD